MIFTVFTKFITSSLDGVEYSNDRKTLISAPQNLVDYVVPKECEIIQGGDSMLKSSFIQCIDTIRNLTFAEGSQLRCIYPYVFKQSSIETIDISKCSHLLFLNRSIFYQCFKLENVFLPEGLINISAGCFYNAVSLKSIKLPDSLVKLENWKEGHDSVFTCCYSLSEVEISENSNLEIIGSDSLASTSITYLYLPKNLSYLQQGIFNTSITSFGIHEQNQYFYFDGTALLNKDQNKLCFLTTKDLETYEVPENIKFIGESSCRTNHFKHIIFNYPITEFGFFCFGESYLEDISIPEGVTYLPARFLDGCKRLKSVKLPSTLKYINDKVFRECYKLASINIVDGIVSIGDYAFSYCKVLKSFRCPKNLTKLGESVFAGSLEIVFDIGENAALVYGSDDVLYLNHATKAFFGKSTDITIPATCTSIGSSTFHFSKITSITIEAQNSLYIGEYAFTNTSLVTVTLPSCLTSIGNYAFANITTLQTINIDTSSTVPSIPMQCFCNCLNLQTITFPTTITSIGDEAFSGCALLKNFDISNTKVEKIGKRAFLNTQLTSLLCPKSLQFIGEEAYKNTPLTSVDMSLSSIPSVEEGTFSNCRPLGSILFSDSTKTIGSFAFSNCEAFTEITLPQQIVTIKPKAFEYCVSFTQFTLKHNCDLDTIEGLAFNGCNKLTKIIVEPNDEKFTAKDGVLFSKDMKVLKTFLPASVVTIFVVPAKVQEIGSYAFHSCRNLRTVVIPEGPIKSVGFHSFDGCKSLSALVIPGTLKLFGQGAFINCQSLGCGSVHYPYEDPIDKEKAIVAGIPDIAFSANCPELKFKTCKNSFRTPVNFLALVSLIVLNY